MNNENYADVIVQEFKKFENSTPTKMLSHPQWTLIHNMIQVNPETWADQRVLDIVEEALHVSEVREGEHDSPSLFDFFLSLYRRVVIAHHIAHPDEFEDA